MHLSDEVVGLEHPPHTVGQAQRHGHGKSLGHGDDYKRHGYHQRVERISHQIVPLLRAAKRQMEIVDHGQQQEEVAGGSHGLERPAPALETADDEVEEQRRGQSQRPDHGRPVEEDDEPSHDDEGCENITDVGYQQSEAVQLLVERRADTIVYLCGLEDLAVLRGVAHGRDAHPAVALYHLRAAQDAVGGKGGIGVEVFGVNALAADRLARERRLIDRKAHRLQEFAVCGNLHSRRQHHNIAHHYLALGDGGDVAVADHLHGLIVVDLVKNGKLLVGLALEVEGHGRSQEYSYKDAHRLEEDRGAVVQTIILVAGYADGEDTREEQDNDQRVLELLQEKRPDGRFFRRSKDIFPVFLTTGHHLLGSESHDVLLIFHH